MRMDASMTKKSPQDLKSTKYNEHSLLGNFRAVQRDKINGTIDPAASREALARCENILNHAQYKALNITIRNIKRLDFLELTFDPRLTVLIGENATGKTTVCESLTKALSWVVSAIAKEEKPGQAISETEIKVGSNRAEIQLQLMIDSFNDFTFSLTHSLQDGADAEVSDFSQLEATSKVIRECIVNDECQVTLPLFIFYSVNRTTFIRGARKIHLNRASAYDNALDEKIRISDMIEWFITLENLASQSEKSEIQDLLSFKNLLLETVDGFRKRSEGADLLQKKLLGEMSRDIKQKIRDTDEKIAAIENRPHTTAEKLLKLVNETVKILIPNASGIFVDRSTGKDRVVLEIYDELHDIQFLSHGQRSVLFMVADLLSRLEILNPHLEDPRQTPGIIIIDEIELHLHPTWQQTIIDSLLTIFPKMQFVITTHSPQVISTVHKDQIRYLKNDFKTNHVKVHSPLFQTRGLSADNILLRILNMSDVPNIKEQQQYQSLEKMIENNVDGSEEGQRLYASLEKHYGKESLEMEKIRNLQKLQRMRQRILERQYQRDNEE